MANEAAGSSMTQKQPAEGSELRQKQEEFEAETFTTLERFKSRYHSLETDFTQQGYTLLQLLQPSTKQIVLYLKGFRPRCAPSLDVLASSPWRLDLDMLVKRFGRDVLESDKFLMDLRKLATDFGHSHDWENIYTLLLAASHSRRDLRTLRPRVSRTHEWRPSDITDTRQALSGLDEQAQLKATTMHEATPKDEATPMESTTTSNEPAPMDESTTNKDSKAVKEITIKDNTHVSHLIQSRRASDTPGEQGLPVTGGTGDEAPCMRHDNLPNVSTGDNGHDQQYSDPPDVQDTTRHDQQRSDSAAPAYKSITVRKRKRDHPQKSDKARATLTSKKARLSTIVEHSEGEDETRDIQEQGLDAYWSEASDADSDGDQGLAGADVDRSVESIEMGRGGSHAQAGSGLHDQVSGIEYSDDDDGDDDDVGSAVSDATGIRRLDMHFSDDTDSSVPQLSLDELDDHDDHDGIAVGDATQSRSLDMHFPDDGDSSVFQLNLDELDGPELGPGLGLRTPCSKTPPASTPHVAPLPSSAMTQAEKIITIEPSTPTTSAATAATSQQHVLDQLAPSAWLADSAMEAILPFWLPPTFVHLKIHTPSSWASFRLARDWRTRVGDRHDLFVDLFRPDRSHWTLLHIQLNRACVVAYDSMRAADPGLEEAAKAIVAALNCEWQQDGWDFVLKHCPQQQNTHDCGVFVILFAMHLTVGVPFPSILDTHLWRTLFALMLRESPFTAQEKALILAVDTAAPALTPAPARHSCKQLVRLHAQASSMFVTSQSKQHSLDHAKRLLTGFLALFKSLATDAQPLTSDLAKNRQFLKSLLARNRSANNAMIKLLHDSNMDLETQIQSGQSYAAKASTLTFLLEQVDALMAECTNIQTSSAQQAEDLMSTIQSDFAVLSAYLKDPDTA